MSLHVPFSPRAHKPLPLCSLPSSPISGVMEAWLGFNRLFFHWPHFLVPPHPQHGVCAHQSKKDTGQLSCVSVNGEKCWKPSRGDKDRLSESRLLARREADPWPPCVALKECISGLMGAQGSTSTELVSAPLPFREQWLPNCFEGGVVFPVFPVLLFFGPEPKFPGEWMRRASQAPFVGPMQRWKVETKDKQPFICPELLFF